MRTAILITLAAAAAACGSNERRPAEDKPTTATAGSAMTAVPPIGDITMLADRTLVLSLKRPALLERRIAPDDPEHARILAHVGPMSPGDSRLVPPWPDEIDDAAVARVVQGHVATTRQWSADEWSHEITGTDRDGNVRVMVTHRADLAARAPGSGKSFALVLAPRSYAVVNELALQ